MSGSEIAVVAGVGFGSALLGVLAGGLTTALLEVWKQVLAGIAAARVIRYEMLINIAYVEGVLEGGLEVVNLPDDAWRTHRLALVPLLSEAQVFDLCYELGFLPHAQSLLGRLSEPDAGLRKPLQDWVSHLQDKIHELAEIERRSRIRLFLGMLRGRKVSAVSKLAASPDKRANEPADEKPLP